MIRKTLTLLAAVLLLAAAPGCSKNYFKKGNSVIIRTEAPDGTSRVRLQLMGDEIIRVSSTPERHFSNRKSLMIDPLEAHGKFEVSQNDGKVSVKTAKIRAEVDVATGLVSFYDSNNQLITGELTKSYTPITVEGKSEYSIMDEFQGYDDEAVYGLGQHQSFEYNRKGTNEELYQYNTKISIPFYMSTRGYGLLWDSYSLSRFGNPGGYKQLAEVFNIYDKDGKPGSLTGTYTPAEGEPVVRQEDSLYFENEWAIKNLPQIKLNGAKVVYEGFIEPKQSANYFFTLYYAGYQTLSIDGKEVVSTRWRPAWNPNSYKFNVQLEQGKKVPIKLEWIPDGDVSYTGLRVAEARSEQEQNNLTLWSEMNPEIDYYFIAGDNMDAIISGYRTLTGRAQVMPKWALGFWQSRERYSTQNDIVSTVAEFRRRGIPMDNIVQDWQYWKDDQWGSHQFDPERYPDPEAMLDSVHDMHARFMISVWPKFYTNTDNYKELKAAGYAYTHAEEVGLKDWLGYEESFYDAYAEGGRKMFWRQMDDNLYSKYGRKIDAWWMDASEPNLRDCLPLEFQKALTTPNGLGSSTEYLNAYALVNADAIYNGQRSIDPNKRVFLLTRSGFAGLQRYSTASWSGDIGTTWTDMEAQMAAGLGYSMSGIPFWGMDIGGFSVESKFYDPANLKEWQELQTRWHQFGAFVPLFRTHGQWPQREIWNIAEEGSETYESILYYIKLRYRLMPYLYSMAGAVNMFDYTIMRGLVMDFPEDEKVRDIYDQWMFGPAFMPCPVYHYGERSREVYFPKGSDWYDFESGKKYSGGQKITAQAPYSRMPLYVRAGSIVPMGREIQWSDQIKDEYITLYIYPGADAHFVLYEDENTNYNYEKDAYATIALDWDDATRTLTIGKRNGQFPGMLQERTFTAQLVGEGSCPVGEAPKHIAYCGEQLEVKL